MNALCQEPGLVLEPFQSVEAGTIADILLQSYSPLLEQLPRARAAELQVEWREYDEAIFGEPETVGACGFVCTCDGQVVGFGSWDPREWPKTGKVGHNCILPQFQRKGYGRAQIEEILCRFARNGFIKAVVRTDEHPFFHPARKMYECCGFHEVAREPGSLLDQYAMLVYELELSDRFERYLTQPNTRGTKD